MKSEFMTIYGRYRKAAGLTQERAAEQEEDAWLKHEIRRDTFDAVFISIVAAAILVLCGFAIGGRA